MTVSRLAMAAGILCISVGVAASAPDQTTLLSECRLDVNERSLAHKQLKNIGDADNFENRTYADHDVSDIRPFGLIATNFSSTISSHPDYNYGYRITVNSTFDNAKRIMLSKYNKKTCGTTNSVATVNECLIITSNPIVSSTSRRESGRDRVYRSRLILYGSNEKTWFTCNYRWRD